MAKSDAVYGINQEHISTADAAGTIMCAHQGNSGAGFNGVVLSGSAAIDCLTAFGFYPRIVRADGAGNFGFQTLDGNQHLIEMDAKTELRSIIVKTIYPAAFVTAALRSTVTKVHVF